MFEPNMGIKNDLRWCIGVELDKVIFLFALITVSRRTVNIVVRNRYCNRNRIFIPLS
jgi:hypothetical protein